MNGRKYDVVSFDVDKTLFYEPALTTAVRALGIGKRWDELHDLQEHKRITLHQMLLSQFRLLVGMRIDDVLLEVSKLRMIRNIRETVTKLLDQSLQVILTTDNPDFLCQYLVSRFGFTGFVSSKVGVENGRITDDITPLPDKRLGIRRFSAWSSTPLARVMHVGDGLNDVPVFRVVGYSIALNSHNDRVRGTAKYQMDTDDLLQVYGHIHSVLA